MIVQMARTLLGRPLTGRVELAFPQPEHYARFAHLWPGPARFNQAKSRLIFPASRLDDSLQMADSVTAKQIEQECERELEKRAHQDLLLSELMRQIRAHRAGFPSLEELARERHVSERTLKRQLQARGTTYRALVDELKRERATELLERKHLSVQEVAHALGYGDPANFHRAFRRWFGTSPESWRKERT
jgi:AraC-like DNA-binding protein